MPIGAVAAGLATGCDLFIAGYGALSLWSKLDGTTARACLASAAASAARHP